MHNSESRTDVKTIGFPAERMAIACLVAMLSAAVPTASTATPPIPEQVKELDRILAISRKKNPQVRPTQPSKYVPRNLPGNLVLWWDSTRVSVANRRFNSIAWIDNQRVLLVGSEDKRPIENAMFVWDTVKATVTPYSDHRYFCYADGYLVSFPAIQRGPIRWGAFGKEREVDFDQAFKATVDWARKYDAAKKVNLDMQCQENLRWNRSASLGPASMVVADLGKRDGMIVSPTTTDWFFRHPAEESADRSAPFRAPMLLVNERFPKGKPLPIWMIEEIRSITFSNYRQRYVLTTMRPKYGVPMGNGGDWPDAAPRPIYLIGADGSVETIDVPGSSGWDEMWEATMAVPGAVFKGDSGWGNLGGGMFLYDGKNVLALDIGRPEDLAVSPDGCRLVYAINNNYNKPGLPREAHSIARFKFINFCQE